MSRANLAVLRCESVPGLRCECQAGFLCKRVAEPMRIRSNLAFDRSTLFRDGRIGNSVVARGLLRGWPLLYSEHHFQREPHEVNFYRVLRLIFLELPLGQLHGLGKGSIILSHLDRQM